MKYKRIISFMLSLVMMMGCIVQLPVSAQQMQSDNKNQVVNSPASLESLYEFNNNPLETNTQHLNSQITVGRIRDEESLNTYVYQNSDGTKTIYFYDHPVQYLDAQGKKQDISLDIADTTDAKYPFRTKANSAVTSFPASLSDGVKLTGNGVELRLAAQLPLSSSKKQNVRRLDTQTVSYIYDANTTIEYSLTHTGFKEDIVVNSYTGQTEYNFMLYTNGLTLTKLAGSYYLTDDSGKIQASIGDVIVFTADERNNAFGEMRAETIVPNQQYSLTIVLDSEYLANPKTVYPIRIDPTITLNYESEANAIADVTLHSTSSSGGERTYLLLGMRSSGGISRILMKFPGVDFSSYAGVTIISATVSLRDLMCEGTQMPVTCYPFTGSNWEESTASWTTVTQSWGEALDSHIMSYSNGTVFGHRYEFDIKDAVQKWVDGDLTITPEKGIIFKADDAIENSTNLESRTFGSFERESYKPVFTMTYQSNIVLSQNSGALYVGESLALTATTAPLGQIVSWESENPEIAIVSENGVVTALSEGTATIVATLPDDNLAVCDIEVRNKRVYLNYESGVNVYKGRTVELIATTDPEEEAITWISLHPSIATVDNNGVVTGLAEGQATIRAKINEQTYAECVVNVHLMDVSIDRSVVDLEKGGYGVKLNATTIPPGQTVTWSSSNPSVATVTQDGSVRPIRAGKTTITAKIEDGTSAYCVVYVSLLNGVYSIINRESEELLHIPTFSVANNTSVKQAPEFTVTDYYVRQLWYISYHGYGCYSIRSIAKSDMGLHVRTNKEVDIFTIGNSTSANSIPLDSRWFIEETDNGYAIKSRGRDSHALQGDLEPTTAFPKVLADTYSATSPNCHWNLVFHTSPPKGIIFYDTLAEIQETNAKRYIAPMEERSMSDMNIDARAYPTPFTQPPISWSSENPQIATVNPETGAVTGVSPGITNIIATATIYGVTRSAQYKIEVTPIPEGTYFIKNKQSGYYTDVRDRILVRGQEMCHSEFDGSSSQQWTFRHCGDGTYAIYLSTESSDLYMGIKLDSTDRLELAVLREGTITNAMKWIVEPIADGSFKFTPKSAQTLGYVICASDATGSRELHQSTYDADENYYDAWYIRTIEKAYSIGGEFYGGLDVINAYYSWIDCGYVSEYNTNPSIDALSDANLSAEILYFASHGSRHSLQLLNNLYLIDGNEQGENEVSIANKDLSNAKLVIYDACETDRKSVV